MSRKRKKPEGAQDAHRIVGRGTNRIGEEVITCSCGATCRRGAIRGTAQETWDLHAGVGGK